MSATKRARVCASKRQEQLAKVAAIRGAAGPGCFRFTDKQLIDLCQVVGSVGLVVDALCMIPRPTFLEAMEADESLLLSVLMG